MRESEVTIRELRNQGGKVIDRVAAGEHLIVTRSGKPVAVLHPVRGAALNAAVVVDHWTRLPEIDPCRLRDDLDAAVDPSL